MDSRTAESERLILGGAITSRRIWIDLLVYPMNSLPAAAVPVIIGMALAYRHHIFAPLTAFLGFLASWLIHIAGLFYNYHQLLVRYPENREHPELVQAMWDGQLKPATLVRAIILCLVLAALTGPYLLLAAGWPVAILAVIGVLASLSYAGGPLAYARLGLSELVFFVMFGIVGEAGIYYAEAASQIGDWHRALATMPAAIWVIGLPAGGFAVNMQIIDDMCDVVPDTAKGWRTGAVRFGPVWTKSVFTLATCFAYIAPFVYWRGLGFSAWILLPLLTLPTAISILRALYTKTRYEDIDPLTPRSALLMFIYCLLLAIGIAIPS
jgi:1,4-dihydroxy-2-naphthoate polyprenyltransferase